MSLGDVSLACCSVLVDDLVQGGMEHACVSPGSRSTPIALALERDPRVTVRVHLDERSSAYFALGIAKVLRRPVAVATTSGTAAAELLPAVIEGSQSRTPLILLTADRPPRLRGTGANQTIDQVALYGDYAPYFESPLPAIKGGVDWRNLGEEVRVALRAQPPGPVHVNLPFDEPLVPQGEAVDLGDPGTAPFAETTTGARAFMHEDLERAVRELSGVERGAIVIGAYQYHPEDVTLLGRRLRWPVLSEPSSGRYPGWSLAAGQALISSTTWASEHRPDVVVQVGATPTTRSMQSFVTSAERLIVIDDFFPEPDPESRATWRLHAHANSLAGALEHRVEPSVGSWLDNWNRADIVARGAIDDVIDGWNEPFEGRVARDIAALIHEGPLVVGSSMPIRDLDYYMAPREGLRVIANRGASGIDGFVSTALGVAAIWTEAPTFALCGDLTFLHDVGALMWNARRGLDAVIVVLNNGGGTIFGFMPQRALPEFERLFETPHGLDIGAICAAAGAGHARVEHANELVPAARDAASRRGVHVVEVLIDPELDRMRHGEVQAAVDDALRALA